MIPKHLTQNPEFNARLMDTTRWCTRPSRGDNPASSLRTPALQPSLLVVEDPTGGSWNYEVDDPILAVNILSINRSKILQREPLINEQELDDRILLFYPHETLCDGAAYASSKGLFDKWNIPPWDSWIWYERLPDSREVLYCWIPPEFAELAALGVSVNPEQCLKWSDESELA